MMSYLRFLTRPSIKTLQRSSLVLNNAITSPQTTLFYSLSIHDSDTSNQMPKHEHCWISMRYRYRAKGDPRFYYAPKGHTFITAHDAKLPPRVSNKRTEFPKLHELKNPIDRCRLYKSMKPDLEKRNAFKRRWKRWEQSVKDKLRRIERTLLMKRLHQQKLKKRRKQLDEARRQWEERKDKLTLPPSLSTYLKKT